MFPLYSVGIGNRPHGRDHVGHIAIAHLRVDGQRDGPCVLVIGHREVGGPVAVEIPVVGVNMYNERMEQEPAQEPEQQYLIESGVARSLLDQLLTESRLYTRSRDYQNLLDFVVRLRNFAPFNAMLLQVQKPGLAYAASANDWFQKFGRTPKEGAARCLSSGHSARWRLFTTC